MFGRKNAEDFLKELKSDIKQTAFEDKVKCKECKCYLSKLDAQKVENLSFYGSYDEFYCRSHSKPYSRMIVGSDSIYYEGTVTMSEDGTPVGYQKIAKK